MKAVTRTVSMLALVATIAPPVMFFAGWIDLDTTKLWMLGATVAWFVATPFWMDR
jgi:hypothetical protein